MQTFLETVHAGNRIPTLRGVKYIDSNVTDLGNATEVANGYYDIVSTHLLADIENGRGTRGNIAYTPLAPYIGQIFALHEAGNETGAEALQARYKLFNSILTSGGGKSQVRSSTKLFAGIDLGPPRLPLVDVTAQQFAVMKAGLESNGFLPLNMEQKVQ